MGLETKAIIRKGVTLEQISNAIYFKYGEITVNSNSTGAANISFFDGVDKRSLFIMFGSDCEREAGIAGVCLTLGAWGNSVAIMHDLCKTFGGYLDENDCDNEGYYPINQQLYLQGCEVTEVDKFRDKVISEFGYNNLQRIMQICEDYHQVFRKK